MVLYITTSSQVLGIVYLNQLKGAHHTHISYHNIYSLILKTKYYLRDPSKELQIS